MRHHDVRSHGSEEGRGSECRPPKPETSTVGDGAERGGREVGRWGFP
jgi:hypothetical protein